MKSLEQIAQELSNAVLNAATEEGTYNVTLAALQQRKQEHEAQVASLTKERDEAREDVKRLDWLAIEVANGVIGRLVYLVNKVADGKTLRAAITQAMTGGTE